MSLFMIRDNATKLIVRGEMVELCFLDSSKTFNVVNHNIVCEKQKSPKVQSKLGE